MNPVGNEAFSTREQIVMFLPKSVNTDAGRSGLLLLLVSMLLTLSLTFVIPRCHEHLALSVRDLGARGLAI
jgi:hypothetical protein